MAIHKKGIFIISVICLILILVGLVYHYQRPPTLLPTYFSYSKAEQEALNSLDSNQEITKDSLQKWDKIMFDLVKKNKLGDAQASRLYAYVYVAQRDAAYLSMNNKHHFMGNIDIVSAKTLCLFFKNDCSELELKVKRISDPYSIALAELIINKINTRMQDDKKQTHLYPEKSSDHDWGGVRPYFGQDTGSWKTWLIKSGDQFVAPIPPAYDSPEWPLQLKKTKDALTNITPEQTKAVVFWAGNPGTITPPGFWLLLGNDYISSHDVSLPKGLMIRSVLAMSIADSVIAIFNSKYTYWVKRPFMLDPSIVTIMPTPNHPSYPAGHSAISSTAATILSYYFPENASVWKQKENEASMSRVWGGIHFTIDSQYGGALGKQVGEAAIQHLKN